MVSLADSILAHPDLVGTDQQAWLAQGLRAAADRLWRTPEKKLTFREFIQRVQPRFQFYRHCEILIAALQKVADGETTRLLIWMPPRHSKTETISRLFSAYYVYRFPERFVGLASYGAQLAQGLSRIARDHFIAGGGRMAPDAGAASHWETTAGGGMWAGGVGGPMTGKGFHLGLIDDPVKNQREAASALVGKNNEEWYRSTFYTRAEPGAAIVVVQTRWPGPGDLSGFLLREEEAEDGESERWHIVSFEAIKLKESPKIPASCTLESDWRQEGEALCPERFPLTRLQRIRARLTAFFWNALFQQRPVPKEGHTFKRHWFPIVDIPDPIVATLRAWDKAATDGDGDYTAGVKWGRDANEIYYVLDVFADQLSSGARDKAIKEIARTDGVGCPIRGEQEPGAAGVDSRLAFLKLLAGFDVECDPSTGDKEVRATPLAAAAENGLVRLVRAPWNEMFIQHMCDFPHGLHDDIADAASKGYSKLSQQETVTVW